jgi:hypothetical protein
MDVQAIVTAPMSGAVAPTSEGAQPEGGPEQKLSAPIGDSTLHTALAQLVGGGDDVTVHYRVTEHPNEIVTVFRNLRTGAIISEFPTEMMIKIAELFNQLAGATIDHSA